MKEHKAVKVSYETSKKFFSRPTAKNEKLRYHGLLNHEGKSVA